MNIKSLFPILESIKTHSAKDWRADLLAGIVVAVMLVPQGMAYAMLAGMPPIYGLYGGLIPLMIYGVMGTSRQMSVGPVAISALLVLAGVSQIAEPFTPEFISLVIFTGLLVGIAQVLLGVFRMGFLVNFISHPVIIGFTSAAAIIISISQFRDILGFPIPKFPHSFQIIKYAFEHFAETNWVSVGMCFGSIFVMLLLRKISRAIPEALIVIIIGTVLVYFFGENRLGVNIVKSVPEGLPLFQLPEMSWEKAKILIPTVFTVTIICIVESIAIAKVIQAKHGDYKIRPNQELLALGFSKIGGAFFQSIPTSGSFSRSAVNNNSGAKSGLASLFTALLIGLTLMFLTPLFYFLPKAVLAAIILISVLGLFEFQEAKHLWHSHRGDFFMMLATFIITLVFGIEEGVFAGVLLSVLLILFKTTKPHMVVVGKLPNSISYRNVERFDTVEKIPGILIVRFDEQLYFANAAYFQDMIQEFLENSEETVHLFLLDASNINNIDSTGIHAVEEVNKMLFRENITFYISGIIGPVRDRFAKAGLTERLGEKSQFINIHRAVTHFQNRENGVGSAWTPEALQSNFDRMEEDGNEFSRRLK